MQPNCTTADGEKCGNFRLPEDDLNLPRCTQRAAADGGERHPLAPRRHFTVRAVL